MAFINGTFNSVVMDQEVMLDLFIPRDEGKNGLAELNGIIYFLHGMGSSQKRFREFTAANRYCMDNKLAIVYISAPMSFYTDMAYGLKYYTYITEELPKFLKSAYNLDFPKDSSRTVFQFVHILLSRKHLLRCGGTKYSLVPHRSVHSLNIFQIPLSLPPALSLHFRR